MPNAYRVPVSVYVEAEDIHAAIQEVTLYLDRAADALPNWGTLTAVDVEAHQAEQCPPTTNED